jgi:hypothetical protein
MKLARLTSFYQLDGVLKGCRPVEAMSKGFTDQCARWSMVATLASMDLYKQLIAVFPGYAPH